MQRNTLSILVGIALLATVAAGKEVDETRATGPDPDVTVEIMQGSIEVTGWDRQEVRITGTVGDNLEGLEISADEDDVEIEVEFPDRRISNPMAAEARLAISVPVGASLEIETFNAEIKVTDVHGSLELATVNGGIVVSGRADEVYAESVSGNITISTAGAEVEAESVSGAVIVDGASGDIGISTMNGRIEVTAIEADSVDLESMSGSIEFRGALANDGDLSASGYSSDIVLVLPASTSASFEIETHTGDIENAFGPQSQRVESFLPGKILEFSTGSGDADVSVETFSGDVKIIKGNG
jgi:DUF4097 and DUF4098 domain-containing protein YvlB